MYLLSHSRQKEATVSQPRQESMGVHGLWKYLGAHNVSKVLPPNSKIALDIQHIFFDMNGVMHSAYTRKAPTVAATIAAVLAVVKQILDLSHPSQSIIFVFDGSAPVAKLSEQRDRRQSHFSDTQSIELNEGEIVTGGAFVLRCEKEIIQFVQQHLAGRATTPARVRINGSGTPGEGETKISNEIQAIFADQVVRGTYTGHDNIVLVGNDSDLVLTSIACTQYTNYFVINPYSLIVSSIGDLFLHWAHAVPNRHLPIELLPSYRIDFVFIMLLAGGDHYAGIEDDAVNLWRKYRHLRADGGFFRRPLVKGEGADLDVELLRQMCAKDHTRMAHYQGSKNKRQQAKAADGASVSPDLGFALLRGAMWSLRTVCSGVCPDYYFMPKSDQPRMAHLRSAAYRSGVSAAISTQPNPAPPLFPLQVMVGVTSAKRFLPTGIQDVISSNVKFHRFSQLTSSSSIVTMTLEIFGALREDALTASEKERMAFSKPITLCDETRMQTYEFPADVNCCRFVLPAHIDELVFTSLFDRHIKILQRYHAKCPVKAVHVDCLRPVSAATVSASVEEAGDGD